MWVEVRAAAMTEGAKAEVATMAEGSTAEETAGTPEEAGWAEVKGAGLMEAT